VTAAGEESQVTLGEGDRVLLDFLPTPSSTCMRNAALELTARVKEDPALTARQIAYDLWLVHETNGQKTTERAQFTARHGEKASFAFPAQRLAVASSRSAHASGLRVTVSGYLRGRIRPDGTIQLALGTSRGLSYLQAGAPEEEGDQATESGEKAVNLEPGEAIRVDLPGAPRGVDQVQHQMAAGLAGHSFALILTAKSVS